MGSLGNLRVAATFELQDSIGEPLRLTGAAVQLIQFKGATFGWVAVPTALLQPFASQVNQYIGGSYQLTGVTTVPDRPDAVTVSGVGR